MGFAVEFRGATKIRFALSSECIDEIRSLRGRAEFNRDVDLVFGVAATDAGESRTIERVALTTAVMRLASMPVPAIGRFEIDLPPLVIDGVEIPMRGGRMARVTLAGVHHLVTVHGDHWTLQSFESFHNGVPPDPRTEQAKLFDESRGVHVVIARAAKETSEVAKLARKMKRSLDKDTAQAVDVIWG